MKNQKALVFVDRCIESFIKKEGRDADLEKAIFDADYCEMLYKELGI